MRTPRDIRYGSAGYSGRYRSIPVEQIAEIFIDLESESPRRAIKGILRIAREQLDARSRYDSLGIVGVIAVAVAAAGLFVVRWVPESGRAQVERWDAALWVIAGVLMFSYLSVRGQSDRHRHEWRQIAEAADASLGRLQPTAIPFQPDADELRTLRALGKALGRPSGAFKDLGG